MSHRREPEVLDLYRKALEEFGRRVHLVAAHQWAAPTPCSEWSVRDLVNHVTAEQLWVPELLMGSTIAEVDGRFDGDVLGENPVAAWDAAAGAAREAFELPRALDLVVHLSYGDTSGLVYCNQMVADVTVHSWDLARGAGADGRLPAELVDFTLREVSAYGEAATAAGLFAPPLAVPADAAPQTRLLALTGRRDGP
ncbi:TIGR03086 family metal-binding protein [Kitasatospora sp. NPDC050543]|uniref:TIGR03086 family metal-binding protein n=1 Tax=Kitasatospora sp. NPDC050543 TaxID=3364054 RepID=UPI003796F329